MNTESIVTTLLAAAALLKGPAATLANQALRDLYDAAKYYLRKKFAVHPDAARALDFALEKPDSVPRKATLIEEAQPLALDRDADLADLIGPLERLTNSVVPRSVAVNVEGRSNQLNVAGGDLIVTSRLVRRNAITPDDRHLAREQRTRLLTLIHELAGRLGAVDGPPNRAAVHHMLQRHFEVASYLLIPRDRYGEALDYLREQCAQRRDGLRRTDPAAFRRHLFRSIFSHATALGWSRQQVYRFAHERLGLPAPLTSLKSLASSQLRSLAAKIRRVVPPGLLL